MAGFEDLKVWQRAIELSARVYREMGSCRDFGFRDQITRSCLSISSNIAEGMERQTPADQQKFLNYARGSTGEFRSQCVVGSRVGFIEEATAKTWVEESREISAMIQGLIRSLKKN